MADPTSISKQEFDDWQKEKAELQKLKLKAEEWEAARRSNDEYSTRQQQDINELQRAVQHKDNELKRLRDDHKGNRAGREAAEKAVTEARNTAGDAIVKHDRAKQMFEQLNNKYQSLLGELQRLDYDFKKKRREYNTLEEEKDNLTVDLEEQEYAFKELFDKHAEVTEFNNGLTIKKERLEAMEDMLQEQFGIDIEHHMRDMDIAEIAKVIAQEAQAAKAKYSPGLPFEFKQGKREGKRAASLGDQLDQAGDKMEGDGEGSGQASPELERKRGSIDSTNALSFIEVKSPGLDINPLYNEVKPVVREQSTIMAPRTVAAWRPSDQVMPMPLPAKVRALRAQRRRSQANLGPFYAIPKPLGAILSFLFVLFLMVLRQRFNEHKSIWLAANEVTRQNVIALRDRATSWSLLSPSVVQRVEDLLRIEYHPMG